VAQRDTLRGRDFRLLVASSGLSSMGDELALIALILKVADLKSSGAEVAALLVALALPMVIFAPAAGVIVDNFETTRTLALASAIQAAMACSLAFAHGMPAILLLAFLLGTGTAVANPALYTLVPAVVGDEKATAANAYLETARYGGMIVGPIVAGTIAHTSGTKAALLVDALTFVVVAIVALGLTTRRQPEGAGEEDQGAPARAGVGIIRRDAVLVALFTIFGFVILFAAMDNVAEVFFAQMNLGADGWGYGLLASAWIVGMAGGASLIARRLPNDRLAPSLMMAAIVGGVAIAVAAALQSLWPAVLLFVVGGVANGVETVSMRSVIVHRVADRFRGRVFAAYGGLANSLLLVATALGGWLVATFDGRATLVIGGLGCIAAGVLGLAWYRLIPAEVRRTPAVGPAVTVPESEVVVRVPETEPLTESFPEL
jgi:MFS family permease